MRTGRLEVSARFARLLVEGDEAPSNCFFDNFETLVAGSNFFIWADFYVHGIFSALLRDFHKCDFDEDSFRGCETGLAGVEFIDGALYTRLRRSVILSYRGCKLRRGLFTRRPYSTFSLDRVALDESWVSFDSVVGYLGVLNLSYVWMFVGEEEPCE